MITKNYSINQLLLFALSFAICLYFGRDVFADPDTAWHIKAGEIIWSLKHIPTHDSLTFSSDQQWYNLSWLWDIAVYLIYHSFGVAGLAYFKAFLYAGLLSYSYHYLSTLQKFSNDTLAVAITLVGLILWDLLYLRPQLASYLFAIAVVSHLNSGSKRHFVIPLITLLWANTHGSFLISFVILGLHFIPPIIEKDFREFKKLLMISLFSAALVLINPLGYNIVTAVVRTLGSDITPYISEWQPFTFGQQYSFTLIIIILLTLGGYTTASIPLIYRMLSFTWLIMAMMSKRNFGYFAVFSLGYLAYLLDPIISKAPSKYNLPHTAKLLLCFVMFATAAAYLQLKKDDFAHVPIKGISFINDNCRGAKIFNDYNYGGYLALWLKNNQYFIDGRAGVIFSEKFIRKYLSSFYIDHSIQPLLDEYHLDLAIINNNLKNQTSYFSYFASWDTIYQDNMVTIYKNKNSKVCNLRGHDIEIL